MNLAPGRIGEGITAWLAEEILRSAWRSPAKQRIVRTRRSYAGSVPSANRSAKEHEPAVLRSGFATFLRRRFPAKGTRQQLESEGRFRRPPAQSQASRTRFRRWHCHAAKKLFLGGIKEHLQRQIFRVVS